MPVTNRLDRIDLTASWSDKASYEKALKKLQGRMANLQNATYHNRHRVAIVLEGWDASGKGGAIRRLTEKLDPRSYRVHAITKPDPIEAREHYLQRFWRKLPRDGHIAIFDRSWYGRVLVERVEGLASEAEWSRAYAEINNFEKTLCDNNIVLIKLMLHISQEEQRRRYAERLDNPKKHWKLTEEDLRNRHKGDQYLVAFEDMFEHTDTPQAPWQIIPGEHKWHARTEVLSAICEQLENAIDTRIPRYSSEEINQMKRLLGIEP